VCTDMQMRELECASERKDQGHVFGLVWFGMTRRGDTWWGSRGDTAGEGRVVVDVEFE
jgi:hypothetical protein